MSTPESLQKTPLYDLHLALGARMVPYAGYSMPVQYPTGLLQEHLHTRRAASLFDVSHMGQIRVHGTHAAAALESVLPIDVLGLNSGQQRYGFLCNAQGGILDDLMLCKTGATPQDGFLMVVNGACKHNDLAHLQNYFHAFAGLELQAQFERALLALQGPQAAQAFIRLAPDAASLRFMQGTEVSVQGIDCFITRSGYSGEDGFEISVGADQVQALAELLLAQPEVKPAGLGARNALRLEAGLCLYGADLNDTITPVEAGLIWAISKARRNGGARAGGFPGADTILAQLERRLPLKQQRVCLLGLERTPVREPATLEDEAGQTIGHICSGLLSPCLDKPIAMGYLQAPAVLAIGANVFARVRNKAVPMQIHRSPFVAHRYVR